MGKRTSSDQPALIKAHVEEMNLKKRRLNSTDDSLVKTLLSLRRRQDECSVLPEKALSSSYVSEDDESICSKTYPPVAMALGRPPRLVLPRLMAALPPGKPLLAPPLLPNALVLSTLKQL
jgi:hypothetical protein